MKIFFPSPGFQVTLDEKIEGKISSIVRQIDVTIRGTVKHLKVLYLIQCKDYTRKADITKVSEFSSVIEDVGATKGFLICAAGFAKTVHQYAKNKRIDLLTVQDINHRKWRLKAQVPVLYKRGKTLDVDVSIASPYFPSDVRGLSAVMPTRTNKNFTRVSTNRGRTSETLLNFINILLKENDIDIFTEPDLVMRLFSNVGNDWLEVQFTFHFNTQIDYYFFFIDPIEYTEIKDHITGEIIPLYIKLSHSAFYKLTPNNKIDIKNWQYNALYLFANEEMKTLKTLSMLT